MADIDKISEGLRTPLWEHHFIIDGHDLVLTKDVIEEIRADEREKCLRDVCDLCRMRIKKRADDH